MYMSLTRCKIILAFSFCQDGDILTNNDIFLYRNALGSVLLGMFGRHAWPKENPDSGVAHGRLV